jgi:hypothetical protein
MRSSLAGLILFSVALLSLTSGAMGQATGQVLGIGFNNYFRPDCWAPLRIQLHSDSNDVKTYMIQVHQQDLDKDTVVYTRRVVLNPKPAITDYFVYFIPQPTDKGLPEGDPKALGEVLKVYLYDESGKTLINTLPITFGANNIDPTISSGPRGRGQKLIVAVTGEHDRPSWGEYRGALGLQEGVEFVNVTADELPDNVLGYQAVDGIVWFDAQAREVAQGGSGAFKALQEWVQEGGQLVVCQPGDAEDRGKIAAFADAGMLPVKMKDDKGNWLADFKAVERPDLEPLYRLAVHNVFSPSERPTAWSTERNWDKIKASKQPLKMFRAEAKPDAVVDVWINWDGTKDKPGYDNTPYIARRAYGMGSVTWVAEDLGSPRLTSIADAKDPAKSYVTGGWPYVWDKVFGWKNDTIVLDDYDHSRETGHTDDVVPHPELSMDAPAIELGAPLLKGMDASARGVWLVTVAIFFFIVYWIIAGPGSYLFLAARKRKGLSWTVFAATALVATFITVLVVKLVLRGDPEVHHITVVRLTPDTPADDGSPRFAANISSRFGLYIPRDGDQTVELYDAGTALPSYVVPLALHPSQMPTEAGFTDTARYDIATDELNTGDVSVRFPYRSTLKKIQTQWNGTVNAGITGAAQLINEYYIHDPADKDRPGSRTLRVGPLSGAVTNATGRDLHDVYFAFRSGSDIGAAGGTSVQFLYVRSWPNGGQLDLKIEYQSALLLNIDKGQVPDKDDPLTSKPYRSLKGDRSQLFGWGVYWLKELPHSSVNEVAELDDSGNRFLRSLPLLAFFEEIGPYKGEKGKNYDRDELLRHGGRGLDVSQLVASGRLVVLAQADGAVPFPLKVNGNKIEGEGVSIYEVSLPLENRSDSDKIGPTTAPSTAPSQSSGKTGAK